MKKKEDNIFMVAIGILVALFLLSFLLGCKTTKTVTETVHESDTLIIHKTDTFFNVKVKEVHDTTKQIETHTYTVNNVGDTIKEIHHYRDITRTLIIDSTHRYQAKVDSLQKLVNKLKNTKQVVKKGIAIPWWAWIVSPLILIAGGGLIVRKILDKKWHIS